MIEYQYDEKRYRRMVARLNLWIYLFVFGIIGASFVVVSVSDIIHAINEHMGLVVILATELVLAALYGLFIGVMIVIVRKQAAKTFAMYSANGIVHEQVEFADDELVITSVSRQSVVRLRLANIKTVKLYKGFFAVTNINKARWVVPLNEQTQLLYDALTGKVNVSELVTDVKPQPEAVTHDKTDDVKPAVPYKALGFEYEITQPQAVSMLTKIISLRFRGVLAALILVSIVFAAALAFAVSDSVAGNGIARSNMAVLIITGIVIVLVAALYCSKGKQGRTIGSNYFNSGAKDGAFKQRIELDDQGIVVINILRDTRVRFRLADMNKVCLSKDFFYVTFKSTEILPIPLTDDTKRLYEILNNAVKRK